MRMHVLTRIHAPRALLLADSVHQTIAEARSIVIRYCEVAERKARQLEAPAGPCVLSSSPVLGQVVHLFAHVRSWFSRCGQSRSQACLHEIHSGAESCERQRRALSTTRLHSELKITREGSKFFQV